jgi:prolyl oligopeptidase
MFARSLAVCLVLLASGAACSSASPEPRPNPQPSSPSIVTSASNPTHLDAPPATRRDDVRDEIHGVTVPDPYRWLEDEKDPAVQAWMQVQNAYARARLEDKPDRDALRQRLRSLMYLDAVSPPTRRGGRLFYTRRHADREKSVFYVRDEGEAPERVLIDPNTMSADGSVSLQGAAPSWDGSLVAYRISRNSSDAATLHVRDVATGTDLPDVIAGARYAWPAWTPDTTGFYYTGLPDDPSIPPAELPGRAEIRFHRIGTDATQDEVVYPALGDPKTFLGVQLSRDGRYLLVSISRGFDSSDIYFKDLSGTGDWVTLTEGTPYRASVDVHDGRFYVLTNDHAPRSRVFVVDPAAPARSGWREVVRESAATLEGVDIVGGKLALSYLDNVSSRIEIRELDGSRPRGVALPGIGTASGLHGRPEDDDAYFSFSSFTSTPKIVKIAVSTLIQEIWDDVKIPVDTSDFEVQQIWYETKARGEGKPTRVPMFVVHRRGVVLDGSHPTLLTGYGGFSVSLTPAFSAGAVLWLERGGIWAVANLRGGGEFGEEWHEAGKGANKQNVFDDFIAAAEVLVERGYTRPDKLAIRGGSNGGLLVGAVMTQRPELFGAVVCEVPLLDMIRYHLFGAGKTWISEYGSAEDPEQFRTLWGYSPYHRVRSGSHPLRLLMNSADSDDRVDPMHARKFVAAMQHATPQTEVLLRIEKNAGHGGADLIKQSVEAGVDIYSFLLEALGETRVRG